MKKRPKQKSAPFNTTTELNDISLIPGYCYKLLRVYVLVNTLFEGYHHMDFITHAYTLNNLFKKQDLNLIAAYVIVRQKTYFMK